MSINLEEVLTTGEAAQRWGKSQNTLKHACSGFRNKGVVIPPRFSAEECRRSAGVWLISREGMVRLYGEEPVKQGREMTAKEEGSKQDVSK